MSINWKILVLSAALCALCGCSPKPPVSSLPDDTLSGGTNTSAVIAVSSSGTISATPPLVERKHSAKVEAECTTGSSVWMVGAESPYAMKCVSGKWIEDKEAEVKRQKELDEDRKAEVRRQEHLQSLWDDIRSKVVSADELEEIVKLGPKVIPRAEGGGDLEWCPESSFCTIPNDYKLEEESHRAANEKIFSDALVNQFRMRLLKDKEDSNPCNKECGQ